MKDAIMKKVACLSIIFLLLFAAVVSARSAEYYIKFTIGAKEDILKITKYISIDNVQDMTVYAYASDRQLEKFGELGYAYEILPHPSTLIEPEMSSDKADIKAWDVYPTYTAYVDMMYQFEIDYPGLCQIVEAGTSVEGRQLLFARISDNIAVEEDEPEVMYTSSIHGDELTGFMLTLRLIDYLLANYGTDPIATMLVDSCEIWINPLANPDGTYAGGNSSVYSATRYNANGVDMNRNFPDPDDGPHPDGNSWQPETEAMMNFASQHSFAISANFHGGAEVINYPWDTWSRLCIDNNWWIDVSRNFADSSQYYSPSGYLTDLNNGITNGYAWYTITGGRQDYMNYWRGCREVTIEISSTKLPSASTMPSFWNYNKSSLLHYLENGIYGLRGVVTDAATGDPIFAKIFIPGHDSDLDSSRVFTDPDVGDYHRMIEAGTYDIEFSAPGYASKTAKSKNVFDYSTTRVDITLSELTDPPALSVYSHSAGLIDPGDIVDFAITLQNTGVGNASNVNSLLTTGDSYISITQDASTYPKIYTGGGTAVSDLEYQISVSPSCPLNHMASFDLIVSADNGYTDTLTFSLLVGQIAEDFETGNFTAFPWTFSGNVNWLITASAPYEGTYCATSGNIIDNQRSALELSIDVVSPGTISFYYRVSSEPGYDYLKFYVDNVEKGSWAGTVGWTQASYTIAAGTHALKWEYKKDGSQSDGSDCGWIDKIVFPPIDISVPITITTASLPNWTAAYPYSEQLEATGGTGEYTWVDKNGDLSATGLTLSSTGLVSGTPVAGGVSFTAQALDTAGNDSEKPFSFTINPPVVIITDSLPEGVTGVPYSIQLASSGGTGVKIWLDKNNDLPGTGLTLSSTGILSGSVSTAGTITFTSLVHDNISASDEKLLSITFAQGFLCGDANSDQAVNVADAVFIINYVFRSGIAPDPLEAGDANFDGDVNIGDAVYLINYVFRDGDAPVCE